MPLSKKDLSQIKGVVHTEVHDGMERLAKIFTRGFTQMNAWFDRIDLRFDDTEEKLARIGKHLK